MRFTLFISAILLLGCTPKDTIAIERQLILSADFSHYDNFFPIQTLNLIKKGIKDKIHIMYVCFDPGIDGEKEFPGEDYMDDFSFKIMKDGKYQPTFDKSALVIGNDFKEYFKEDFDSYKKLKAEGNISRFIEMPEKPEWWQYDQTPKNSKGKPMTFICQIDMGRIIINDDCRLFVFYDQDDRMVKYVYQRT
ncbi:hypothetical protein [Fluviicola taffensis]|uniref:Lipoprotein n=1 Tax=Fluviicola taffensis (strain DSM 16823 / NCIMB 13979 / RW262) TaxID=755732 RepID=F2IA48_FLUTR|nr:hypothetical protein [Fluviicola taffensis]AEA45225.1 hypothetical protein Fluta_3252 [Fluviicola taffensis DSM 16823]